MSNTTVDEFKTIPNTLFNLEIRNKYLEFEKDYQDTEYSVIDLKKKYGSHHYLRLYHEFIERGGMPRVSRPKRYGNVKNYHYNKSKKTWVVVKRINGKQEYFGGYKTEKEAQQRVEELKKNNWTK